MKPSLFRRYLSSAFMSDVNLMCLPVAVQFWLFADLMNLFLSSVEAN